MAPCGLLKAGLMNPEPLLLRGSLGEISARLQSGELTPGQLAESALEAARRGARSRAFLMVDETGARARAAALEASGPGGPLWGLPVSVKDLFDVAGWPTTCGSPFYAGTRPVPVTDAPYVADWRAQGTVLVGKTNLNEFAYGITGENRWFGDVTQSGRPDRLTGGSSSGAAASVLMGEWNHPYSREEAVAAQGVALNSKYWPSVGRVDNVYGDRNLFCSCVPVGEPD